MPRVEQSACPVEVPAGERVECRYLVVAEDRRRRGGPAIKLPFIILKSDAPTPAPDPVLRTLGGPGSSSLRMVRGRRSSPWLKNRDVIIFEQRGTRHAQPALECPEIDAAEIESAKRNFGAKPAVAAKVRAARACRERLRQQGVNLTAYDSAASAADIEDLRRLMGYEKWNLYGVSYSSRLMLNVVRDYPRSVRSIVLESVLPPSVNYDEVGVDLVVRALKVLFANCAADEACRAAYPELESRYYDALRRAEKNPIRVTVKMPEGGGEVTVSLTGQDVATWVADYLLSAEPEMAAAAPLLIHRVTRGDYEPLKAYAESKLGSSGSSWGMRYSVWCREEMPFESRRKIEAQAGRHPGLKEYDTNGAMPSMCRAWNVPPAKAVENLQVRSDVPVLLLTGEYDAYTPPSWGRLAARTLSCGYFFELPGVGHGPGFYSRCAVELVSNFFEDPSRRPAAECVKTMTRPKFVIRN